MRRSGDVPTQWRQAGVTPREAEVLAAVAARLRNREIAQRLHISVRTVESHIAALLRKLGAPDRSALVEIGGRAEPQGEPLPAPLTSFVGRERELAEVEALLADHRLVTLTGAAGAGKTRLGLQLAVRGAGSSSGGVRFADLAPVTAERAGDAVARSLGVQPPPGRPVADSLRAAAAELAVLLVLDNCEHLLAEVAALVVDLLPPGGQVRLLVTSREPLGVPGEVSYQVRPLAVPTARASPRAATASSYDAVRLFVDRGRAALPGFALTDANAADVSALCQRLDGLPLAIELAASRVRSFPPAQLVAHLDQRLDLLAGPRTAGERHRTLRAAIDWSYQLLEPDERWLFDQLGVFPSDFDYDAVVAVCAGDGAKALQLLPSLVDRSLVSVTGDGPAPRYRLLETVRAYAAERLAAGAASGATRDRHRDHYLELAQRGGPRLHGPQQAHWLAVLQREHDNLRAALAWSLEHGDPEPGLRLAQACWWFWHLRGYFDEGRRWLERLLAAAPDAPSPVRAGALRALGVLALRQGDYAPAAAVLAESLTRFRELADRRGVVNALTGLGMVSWRRGEFAAAAAGWSECLTLARQLGDPTLVANTLNNLGLVLREQGEYERAAAAFEEGAGRYEALGDAQGRAMALGNLGQLRADQDRYAEAEALSRQSLAHSHELGDRFTIAIELFRLGALAAVRGDYPAASKLVAESLEESRRAGNRQRVAYAQCGRAEVAYLRGDLAQAASDYQAAARGFRELGEPLGLAAAELGAALTATAAGDSDRAAARGADCLARYVEMGHRKGAAWSRHVLAGAARLAGDHDRARRLDQEALAGFRRLGSRLGAAYSLEGLAAGAAATEQPRRAARLLAVAASLREAIGAPLPPVARPGRDAATAPQSS